MAAATFSLPALARQAMRRARRFFASASATAASSAAGANGTAGVFTGQGARFAVAQTSVRAFYAFLLYYLVVGQLQEFSRWIERPPVAPLWPLAWLRWAPSPALGLRAMLGFYTAATLAGAFWPGARWARAGAWLGLLELVALRNSYGKIGHSLHLLVLMAFVLILLPRGWHLPAARLSRRARQETLLVFWTCQAALLLSYTMSGLGKVGGALYQTALGQPSAFWPGGLGAHVAERLLQTHSQSALGGWIIDHPWLTWPAMPGAIYLELFSFWIAFRPALARLWAGGLILLHVGICFAMTINFPQNCLLLALFFFQSPFQPASVPLWRALADLPLVGEAWKLQTAVRRRFDLGQTHRAGDKRAPAPQPQQTTTTTTLP